MNENVTNLLEIFGCGLMAIGGLCCYCNWVVFFMNKSNQRRGIERHVSMVGCLGLCLPLGCLLIPPLRWHSLWVAWLDPFFFFLIFFLIKDSIEFVKWVVRLTADFLLEKKQR
jgi:hypothetical protein